MSVQTSGQLPRHTIELPTLTGVSAVFMWSATVGLYRGISEAFGAVGGSALIFTVSAVIAVLCTGPSAFSALSKRYLIIGGGLFITYETALALAIGYATTRQQALEVGTVNYLWPSFTIALAVWLGYQRADWRMIPGLLLSLTGILWVSSGDRGISFTHIIHNIGTNPVAYGLARIAAPAGPVYTRKTRAKSEGKNGVPVFLTLTAIVLWIKYFSTSQPPLHFNFNGAIMVLTFGVLTTLAYSAWNYGVMHGNLTLMATASYFSPVLSVLMTSLLLHMMPGHTFWLGSLLVTAGSLICWLSTHQTSVAA